jgi:RHS repeat-associated protein
MAASLSMLASASLVTTARAATGQHAVRDLSGCQNNALPRNDDGSTGQVSLPFTAKYFGHDYAELYVNNNGNVTFDAPQSIYTPYTLMETGRVIIAPFFADVDTRNTASLETHYGNVTVEGHSAFCVDWVQVGYYNSKADKLNSFQLLLVDRSDVSQGAFDIEYNYDQVQWETGEASGGAGGIGGTPARVGFSNGIDHAYEAPGSGQSGAFLDSNTSTGLIYNSRASNGVQGRYVFHVRNGVDDAEARLYALNLVGGSNPVLALTPPCAGDPIDCATGDYWTQATDAKLVGRGPVAGLTRTYNSLSAATDGAFGHGWSSLLDVSLHQDTTGTVTITQENGSQVSFTQSSSTYVAPSYVLATLTRTADGTWTLTRRHREHLIFDATGALTAVSDLNGNTTTVTRSTGLTTDDGRTVGVHLDSSNHVTSIVDPMRRTTQFAYSTAGDLASVTDPTGAVTRYDHDNAHHLTVVTSPTGGLTKMVYDSTGRATSQTNPVGAVTALAYAGDASASTTTITNPDGSTTIEKFKGLLLTSRQHTDAHGNSATTTYIHDPATLAVTDVTDPMDRTAHYDYDAAGNLTSVTEPSGDKTTATYDALGDVTAITDALGSTTSLTYSSTGDLLSRTVPTAAGAATQKADHTANGDTTGLTDADGNTAQLTYDEAGRLVQEVLPAGEVIRCKYNNAGELVALIAPGGAVTRFRYDAAGHLSETIDPKHNVTRDSYDSAGRRTAHTDAMGQTTRYAYDAAGQLAAVTRPDGSKLTYRYDEAGRVVAQTDASGHTTSYTYDGLGRLASTQAPGAGTTTATYDAADQLSTATDASGTSTAYTWTPDGQLATLTRGSTHFTYTYDAVGRRTAYTDATGTTQLQYDPAGRLTTAKDGFGATVSYGYDLAGLLTSLTYPDGSTVTRTYDADQRLTSVRDFIGKTFTFTYDAAGLLSTQANPNGVKAAWQHDADNLTTGITISKKSSALLRLTDQRNANGLVTRETAAGPSSNDSQRIAYDALGQITADATSDSRSRYSYDPSGNLTQVSADRSNANTLRYDANGVLNTINTRLKGHNRLNASIGTDALGSRTSVTASGLTATYTWNAGSLASYSGPSGGPIPSVEDLTASAKHTGATTNTSYTYDAQGLRTNKTVDGTPTHFAYDRVSMPQPLIIGDGTLRYITGPDGRVLEQVKSDSTPMYLHQDQLGSTRLVTDARGNIVATYSYTPFGTLRKAVGHERDRRHTVPATQGGRIKITITPVLFAGGYADAESGLYWLVARSYDPATGQFLSRDPLVAITWAPFSYAMNSGLNFIDPMGLSWYNPTTWTGKTWATVGLGVALVAVGVATFGVGDAVLGGVAITTETTIEATSVVATTEVATITTTSLTVATTSEYVLTADTALSVAQGTIAIGATARGVVDTREACSEYGYGSRQCVQSGVGTIMSAADPFLGLGPWVDLGYNGIGTLNAYTTPEGRCST